MRKPWNKTHRLTLLCGALVVAAALLWTGCRSMTTQPAPPPEVTIRVAYRPAALADITPVIIKEAGLHRPGLKVQLVPASSPPDALKKYEAGEVDAVAGVSLEPLFQYFSDKKASFTAYYLQVDRDGAGWVSLVGSKKLGVAKISDLAGKPVASLPTTQAQYLLRRILTAAGIPQDKIKIVTYNHASPITGLRSGEHAGLFGLEPAISRAADEGDPILYKGPASHFLYNDDALPLSASIVSNSFAAAHPQALQAFESMVDEAVDLTNKQPDKVRAYFHKEDYGGLSDSISTHLSLPNMVRPDAKLKAVTLRFVADLIKDNQVKPNVDISPLFPASP